MVDINHQTAGKSAPLIKSKLLSVRRFTPTPGYGRQKRRRDVIDAHRRRSLIGKRLRGGVLPNNTDQSDRSLPKCENSQIKLNVIDRSLWGIN